VNYATQLKAVEDKTAKAFIDKHGQEKFDKIMGGGGGGGEPSSSMQSGETTPSGRKVKIY
jgi:hypothetical protein